MHICNIHDELLLHDDEFSHLSDRVIIGLSSTNTVLSVFVVFGIILYAIYNQSLTYQQLRYQKCLDAHPVNRLSSDSGTPNKGFGATIKTLMSSFTQKKDKCTS